MRRGFGETSEGEPGAAEIGLTLTKHPDVGSWGGTTVGGKDLEATARHVREIDVSVLRETVARLLVEANYRIPDDILGALREAVARERSELGRRTLEQLVRNYEIGILERVPVCQDSGLTVVIVEMGQDVHWVGGNIYDAINQGIRDGTLTGYLRRSVVSDPLLRRNTGDNAPGVVHIELVPGDRVRVTVASKGFGSENMSALRMLTPADGIDGVKQFVLETVDRAGANACPPLIVGVGIGGTFEMAAYLAKKAVLRPITQRHRREDIRRLEEEILEQVNALGIGPQGFGGLVTALAVNVEVYPTHIAGLPVAVNLGCHSNRRMTAEL
jgi:fumarate hydratase subunit alpha